MSEPESSSVDVTAQASRLRRLYIFALSAVACLSILGQCLVQWSLQRQLSDSTVVNVAGRQRMLSQALTKAALALRQPLSAADEAGRRREIETIVEQWSRAQRGLASGDAGLRLPGRNSDAISAKLQDLQPNFAAMVAAAETILREQQPGDTALTELLTHEPQFLAAMDSVVETYEREARERVDLLRTIEIGLLVLTLLVLVGEGLFVFRPAVQRLHIAADELAVAKRRAEAASEAKSRFLATMSHELRNPLQAVLGSAELAAESTDAERRLHLETITAAGRSLLGLLNDLLDTARIEAGKLEIVIAPLQPRRIVHEAVAMVEPAAAERNLSLRFTVADDVPRWIAGDELRLKQVLLNLLGNAIKFTAQGSVSVALTSDQANLRFEVRDTGRGISPDEQAKIFAPFTQLHDSDRPAGVGLGLSVCRRLVELMHGQIGVTSTPGEGSVFWFMAPLAISAEPPPVALPTATQTQAVLIVDDDPVNRRLVVELVQRLGCSATAVGGGEEALQRLREQPFQVVLLDWQMPGMNGGDLARSILADARAAGRSPPRLIALSAAVIPTVEAADVFERWLTKPVGSAELAAVLADARHAEPDRWSAAIQRLGGRRDLFLRLGRDFAAGLPAILADLQSAANGHNMVEVSRLAHLLAGQAAVFSANELNASARALEDAAEAGDLSPVLLTTVVEQSEDLAAAFS